LYLHKYDTFQSEQRQLLLQLVLQIWTFVISNITPKQLTKSNQINQMRKKKTFKAFLWWQMMVKYGRFQNHMVIVFSEVINSNGQNWNIKWKYISIICCHNLQNSIIITCIANYWNTYRYAMKWFWHIPKIAYPLQNNCLTWVTLNLNYMWPI
jgi:hypothetical protein